MFKTTKNPSVSPTKVSKGKLKYIHFLKGIKNTLHRGICFSSAKHVHVYICTYVHIWNFLPFSSNLFHNWTSFISNLFRFIFSSLGRYLSEVSPVKLSKDKKRKYFNFAIQNDNSMYRGVWFSAEKHALFNDISKSENNGMEWKLNGFEAVKTMKT